MTFFSQLFCDEEPDGSFDLKRKRKPFDKESRERLLGAKTTLQSFEESYFVEVENQPAAAKNEAHKIFVDRVCIMDGMSGLKRDQISGILVIVKPMQI